MSDVQDKEWFVQSCGEAALYPTNLVYHDTYDYNLKAYTARLDERESLLFCIEKASLLDLWEYDDFSQGNCLVTRLAERLANHLKDSKGLAYPVLVI
jgi:hypothetical protein